MSIEIAQLKDNTDPLAGKRKEFALEDRCIYFDGNSLGPLPKRVQAHLAEVVEQQWGKDLIRSWNTHAWIDLPFTSGEKIARLIGAQAQQTICCDSISINIFKLLSTVMDMQTRSSAGRRSIILSEANNFPTDLYMVQGMSSLVGPERCQLKMVEGDIGDAIDESVAVVLLSHVNYRSGKVHDMEKISRRARECGALVLWDLAHSAGAVPLALDKAEVDFAVGCGYKFLNGGPGSPAFLYVAKRHHNTYAQALSGWMGHRAPFDFSAEYQQGQGVAQYLCGTPSILAMAALDSALDVFEGVALSDIRAKSLALSDFLMALVEARPELNELTLLTPREHELRGSQVSFTHPYAYQICQALIARNIIPDFRSPDILRFGITPLYMRFIDVVSLVDALEEIVSSKAYLREEFSVREKVT